MAFIFGGNTGMSYEDIQRKRQVADSLLGNAMRPAKNVGEGLAAIGAALAVRGIEKRTKAADEENRRAFNDQWGSIFGGNSPEVVTQASYSQPEPVDPMDPQAIASDTMKALGKQTFPASLVETESGGNWNASNNVTGAGGKAGHFGRLQFGQARLEDAKRAGVIPADMTPDQFMASPNAQMAVEQWHFGDINSRIDAAGLGKYEGQVIGGVPMTRDGMLAMAHLGGFGGLQKFVESNGQYNPADAYGTSLADYGVRHGGGQPIRTAQAGGFDLATLAELAGNPYASPGQKAVLQALIGQQTAAMDPMRALELERAQLEIDALRNPQPTKGTVVGNRIIDPTTGRVIYEPEPGAHPLGEYGLSPVFGKDEDGNVIVMQLGKDGTAVATKLPEGVSPDLGVKTYEAARGTAIGKAEGESVVSSGSDMQAAQNALDLIDSIRNDPARKIGTGKSSIMGAIPGTKAYDFARKVEQAKSGAFMTAIQQLRGMGALSNNEGQTATAAVTRMSTAMTEKGFLEALADYEKIVRQGYDKAARAGGADPAQPGASGTVTHRFNPATGKIEAVQ